MGAGDCKEMREQAGAPVWGSADKLHPCAVFKIVANISQMY